MFDFLIAPSYNDQVVARYEADGVIVDTAEVNDGQQLYETGVCHPEYNDNKWVIVEAYDTKTAAQSGHDKWVKIMTSPELPEFLVDCNNSQISSVYVAIGGDLTFPRKPKEVSI